MSYVGATLILVDFCRQLSILPVGIRDFSNVISWSLLFLLCNHSSWGVFNYYSILEVRSENIGWILSWYFVVLCTTSLCVPVLSNIYKSYCVRTHSSRCRWGLCLNGTCTGIMLSLLFLKQLVTELIFNKSQCVCHWEEFHIILLTI